MKLALSLCMIVKNEGAYLSKCLNSVRSVVDEIVIVDTGSTDRTIEIARNYGAKVIEHPWNDDFSEARNVSLDHATGDWILVLDADEVIAEMDLPKVWELCQSKEFAAFSFTTRNYTNDSSGAIWVPDDGSYTESKGFAGWFPSDKVRLFKNDKRIRFEGVVHELVDPCIKRLGLAIGKSDVPIHHYGSADRNKKTASYLAWGKKKVAVEGEINPKAHYEYGVQCMEAGKHAEAVMAFKKALELDPGFPLVHGLMGASLVRLGRYGEAVDVLKKAVAKEPKNAGAHNNLGSAYYELGNWGNAARHFEQAIRLNPGYAAAYKNLGMARVHLGDLAAAREAFKKALELNPSMKEAQRASLAISNLKSQISNSPTLSLCMIVKDEEKNLPSCLESVRDVVDEIIIVDTGSKDRTVEVARSFGAGVYHFPWNGDFSAARNESIRHATGDYILYLDADEKITEETLLQLKNLKRRFSAKKDEAYILKYYCPIDGCFDDEIQYRLRIFPNLPGVYFEREIHEDVSFSLGRLGIRQVYTEVTIWHEGYRTEELNRKKLRRNIEILESRLEADPEDMLSCFYAANTYHGLGELDKAINSLSRVVKNTSPEVRNTPWYPYAFVKLAQYCKEEGRFKEAEEIYKDLAESYPNLGVGRFFYGEFLFEQGRLVEALRHLEVAHKRGIQVAVYPLPVQKINFLIHFYLGECYLQARHFDTAVSHLMECLVINPEVIDVYLKLGFIYAATSKMEKCASQCEQALRLLHMSLNACSFSTGNLIPPPPLMGEGQGGGGPLPLIPSRPSALADLARLYNEIGLELKRHGKLQTALLAFKVVLVLTKMSTE
ncbi:MAG: glycosyltransferase [Thermodesulfobacteriota bacterium]